MPEERSLLVVDGLERDTKLLADRLHAIGFRVRRVKTAEEAFALAEDPRFSFGAALVPPDLAVTDLSAALEALATRAGEGSLVYVAVGARPGATLLERLREAHVELALWEPFGDQALRFQVNRALARELAPRREPRAPVEAAAEVWAGGRRKAANVYTLSAGGVFLETPRPSLLGTPVGVELRLASGPARADGRVVCTNVPGNLRRRMLPIGMGVAFTALDEGSERAIRDCVAQTSARLVI